jgi:hypothetical protein
MKKKELINQLDKIVKNYSDLDLIFEKANDLGVFHLEGHFADTVWRSFEGLLEVIEKQLDTDWLTWYIYDNSCGENGLSAKGSKEKKMKEIKTTKDLAKLILKET